MKILQILCHPDYDNNSRVANLLADIGEKELRKKGHKVYIITTTDPDAKAIEPNVLRIPSIEFKPAPQYRLGLVYSAKIIKKIKIFVEQIVVAAQAVQLVDLIKKKLNKIIIQMKKKE